MALSRFLSQYGMLGVLLLLCLLFSILTMREQHPTGEVAAGRLAESLRPDGEATPGSIGVGGSPKMRLAPVVIVAGDAEADRSFADHLAADL
ncbi:MAG: hypothetical protein GF330_03550, partial [Candidatus Eisenbacteria bacterium]|nr:hypothetical protein [Candidatus Eisenbacteria bacterium]